MFSNFLRDKLDIMRSLCGARAPKPSMSRSSLMTTSSSESPGEPFTVIFSPSLLTKCTVTLLSDLKGGKRAKEAVTLFESTRLKTTDEQRRLARTKVSLYHPPVVTTHYCKYEVSRFLVCFFLRFVCEPLPKTSASKKIFFFK